MKALYVLFLCLFFQILTSTGFAKTEVIFPEVGVSVLQENVPFRLLFDSPMISEKTVGKEVEDGYIRVSPRLKYKSKWLSRNELEIIPSEAVPFRSRYDFRLAGGTKTWDGKALSPEIGSFSGKNKLSLSSLSPKNWDETLSCLPDVVLYSEGDPLPMELFTKAFFQDKDGNRIPANIHAVTSGEVNSLFRYYSYRISSKLSEELLKKKDYVIPFVVNVMPREKLTVDKDWSLVVPEAGAPKPGKNGGYDDFSQSLGTVAPFSCKLRYEPDSQEKGRARVIELTFNHPTKPMDVNTFFRDQLTFEIEGGKRAENVDSTAVKAMEFEGEKLTLEPDPSLFKNEDGTPAPAVRSLKNVRLLLKGEGVFLARVSCAGVEAQDGQSLPHGSLAMTAEIKEKTPDLSLNVDNNGVLSSGARALGISMDGLSKVRILSKKIAEDYGVKTLDSYGFRYNKSMKTAAQSVGYTFIPFELLSSREETADKEWDVKGKENLTVTLDELFGKKVEPGLYFIEVQGDVSAGVLKGYKRFGMKDDEGNKKEFYGNSARFAAQALLQVTDLGLLWKSNGKHLYAYGYSLSDGKPLESAVLEFLGQDGRVLEEKQISQGICSTEIPANVKYLRIATKKDAYLTPIQDYTTEIGLWNYNLKTVDYYLKNSSSNIEDFVERKVFVFTDRRLYRPGEKINLKGIVRGLKANELSLLKEKAFLSLSSPQETRLLKQEIKFSDYGSFDATVALPPGIVGEYKIEVYFPRDGKSVTHSEDTPLPSYEENPDAYYDNELDVQNRTFTSTIQVQEFKRNAFEVKSALKEVKPGDRQLQVSTEAMNYTGTPVADGKAEWRLEATESNFYPDNFKDYKFGDHREYDSGYWKYYYGFDSSYDSSSSREHTLKNEGKLDAKGKGESQFTLPVLAYPRTLFVNIDSCVTDSNEQELKSSVRTRMHPAHVYVGIRENSQVEKEGAFLNVGLVAVQPDGKAYDKPLPVKISVKCRQYTPIRYTDSNQSTVKNSADVIEVCSMEETILPTDTQQAEQGGKKINIPTKGAGEYTVDIEGKDEAGQGFRSTSTFWVYGADVSPWEYVDGLKINLIPDKGLYQPGDTAKILIQTPIEGEAIVTVEREGLLRSYLRKISPSQSLVEVPLEASDAPNVFVSVFLVKGALLNSRQLKEPQLKLGYCTLLVQPKDKILDVKLTVPEKSVLPGAEMTVSGKVSNAKGEGVSDVEVTLFAEDEGTLDVIGYRLPNPLRYFYDSRVLGVSTYTMLTQILSEEFAKRAYNNKGKFIGGGVGGAKLARLEELMRKNFDPCAFWLTNVKTSADGSFSVKVKNPDTLTRYRVMAVALDKGDSFGSGESAYVVNKPVMVEPAPPVFASVGDKLVIPVSLTVNERKGGAWKLSLKCSEGVTVKDSNTVVTTPANGQMMVPCEVSFAKPGKATLTWSLVPVDASGNPEQDASVAHLKDFVEMSFPVRNPVPELKALRFFRVIAGSPLAPESLLPAEISPSACELTLRVSTSPLVCARGSVQFLKEYPYGCLEQKTSKLIPWLYADVLNKFMSASGSLAKGDREQVLTQGISSLLSHLSSSGALCYWSDSVGRIENNHFTQYAAYFLVLCRDQGLSVPNEAFDRVCRYLKTQEDMFSLMVLAKAGRLSEAEMNRALDKREGLGYADRLYLAMALLETKRPDARKIAAELINSSSVSAAGKESLYGSEHVLPLELMARTGLDPADAETANCFARFIAEKMQSNSSGMSTWTGGWDMLALGQYLAHIQAPSAKVTVEMTPKSGKKESRVLSEKDKSATFAIASGVVLNCLEDKSVVYGELEAKGQPASLDFSGIKNKGFAVSRVYEKRNEQGKWEPAHEFSVGDVVRVTLLAEKTDASPARYVAIEDYVPSAFEPINPVLKTQSTGRMENSDYGWNNWISHNEFRKESVRFFADNWFPKYSFKASYLARVTKSGEVTAPPAKVELMYMPEVYGLSSSEQFKVAPRS